MRIMGKIRVRPTGAPVPMPFGVAITGEIEVPDIAYIGRRILSGELERVMVSEKPAPLPAAPTEATEKKNKGNK